MKVARPVRRSGPGKRTRSNPGTAPGADSNSRWGWEIRITGPTTYDLISHLGTVHHVTLPPTQKPVPPLRPTWRRHLEAFRK